LAAQLPIGRALVACTPVDGPIANKQLIDAGAEPLSCCLEKGAAHFGTGLLQRAATLDGRSAASRDALVGTAGCVGGDHADACVVDVQLFCGDLGERRDDPLADLDLSGSNLDHAVRLDRNPTIETDVARETWGKRSGAHINGLYPCSSSGSHDGSRAGCDRRNRSDKDGCRAPTGSVRPSATDCG